MINKLKQDRISIIVYSLLFILLIQGCSQKSENLASLPGCPVKFTNEQILDIAQKYLKTYYPNQTIKEVKLTVCEGEESLFEAIVYENDAEIAVLLVRGDTGEVNYIGR